MKRVTLKRISAFVLAMIMTLSLCPVTALAELIPERYEASFSYAAEDDGISNDELFAAYAQREFDAALGYETPSFYRTSALEAGTLEKEIYDALKAELAKIAAGDESSTVITVAPTGSWSAEDLGVTAIFENSALTADAKSAIGAKLTLIYQCLLADSPLELYWHDKTIGYNASYSYYIVEPFSAEFTFVFAVATDYLAEGDTTGTVTDTTKTGAAATAVANAQAIVDANDAKSDKEKLAAYKDAICNLVSYNQSAASFGSSAYGINPWQMVYVFDGNDSTNVVCEGYAKAFQYLCDLTEFDGDIECHTVSGYMSGGTGAGGHMWNVVTMDDGKNYLVDVTNCDSGTIGADDKLFMAYTTNSADNNQTHIFTIEGQNIVFTYDAAMADLFCDGYLALSTAAYTKPVQSLEATATLTGSTNPLAPGDTVTLTLSFDGINIAGIDATLAFDDAVLTLVNAETLVGGTMDAETLKFVFLNESSPINAATDVLKVTLKVKDGATAGAELNVSFNDIVVSNGAIELDVADATWEGTVAGEAEARWGLATGTDRDKAPADNDWVKSGTLADAMVYANSFASGTAYIQLLSDVNTTAPLIFATGKTTILDLNGHTIDRGLTDAVENGEVIAVNGDLTIVDNSSTDVSKQGKITGGYTAPPVNNVGGGGGGVNVFGSLTMNGGVITENIGTTGGVWVVAGDFTMNWGAITGNTASDMGGGVYVNSRCTFTMNGGIISDNTAVGTKNEDLSVSGGLGGGVYNNGTFAMIGGIITNNTAMFGGGVCGNISVSGSPVIAENYSNFSDPKSAENVFLFTGKTITVVGALNDEASIGITTGSTPTAANPVTVAQGHDYTITESDFAAFFSDENYAVTLSDNGAVQLAPASQTEPEYTATNAFGWNGVYYFTGIDGSKLTYDYSFSANNSVISGTVLGSGPNTVYLTASKNSSLVVTAEGSDTNLLEKQNGVWIDFGGNAQSIYKLTVSKPADNDTVTYTVTRTIEGISGVDVSTLTFEFVPVFTNAGNINGVHNIIVFTGLDGSVLENDESFVCRVDSNGASISFPCGDVASKTVYLATNKWDSFTVDGVTPEKIGAWIHRGVDDMGHEFEQHFTVYKLTVTAPTTGTTVSKTATRSWTWYDENQQVVTESESVTLTFDFSPEFTNTGFDSMWGIFAFTDLNDTNLYNDGSIMCRGDNNSATMTFPCGDVASKTVYLATSKWDTFTVDGVIPEKMGTWTHRGVDDMGHEFEQHCTVYKLTVTAPTTGTTVSKTATRSWTWYDENQQVVTESESVTLTFDFSPEFTYDEEVLWGNCGILLFTDLNGSTLSTDRGRLSWWDTIDGNSYSGIVCGDENQGTVYLGVSQWNSLEVSDNAKLTKIGTLPWSFSDDQGNTWSESYNIYEMTVEAPVNSDTAEYTVTRSWDWWDDKDTEDPSDDELIKESVDFTLLMDFSPILTLSSDFPSEVVPWDGGMPFFTDLDGTTLGCDLDVLFTGYPDNCMHVFCPDRTAQTLYTGAYLGNTLEAFCGEDDVTLTPVGVWIEEWVDDDGIIYRSPIKIYRLDAKKTADSDTVDYKVIRTDTWWADDETLVEDKYPVTLSFEFTPIFTVDDNRWYWNGVSFFTDYNAETKLLSCDDGVFVGIGESMYVIASDTEPTTVYLVCDMYTDFTVTAENSTTNLAEKVSGKWFERHDEYSGVLHNIYKLTVAPPTEGTTTTFNVTRTWTNYEDGQPVYESFSFPLVFDTAPTLTPPAGEPLWSLLGPVYTGVDGTTLLCDKSNIMQRWYENDEIPSMHMYVACGDVDQFSLYWLPMNVGESEYVITQDGAVVELPLVNGTLVDDKNDFCGKLYELAAEKPNAGNTVEYVITETHVDSWDDNGTPDDESDDIPTYATQTWNITFDFSPALTTTPEAHYFEDSVGFFTKLTSNVLAQDAAVPMDSNSGWGNVYCFGKAAQTLYLAVLAGEELNVADLDGNDISCEQVGTWTEVPEDLEWDQPTIRKIYKLTAEKPDNANIAQYTLNHTHSYWDDEDNFITVTDVFDLTFDFAPLLSGNRGDMEKGVALFSNLDENGVLRNNGSVRGMRGSAMVFCGGSDRKTIFLAVPMDDQLTVTDSMMEKQILDRVGVWTFDASYYNVYALSANAPADGGEIVYTVTRSFSYSDNSGVYDVVESFPLIFDFTLNPNETMPLTIDGIRIYSANNNGKLGYSVPDTYDELGANDEENILFVPSRPNQDKTLYLASNEKLYVDGVELPTCSNPTTVGSRTVYMLTAEGQDMGNYLVNVSIGSPELTPETTIAVNFIFFSVMFEGTSFYTASDETLGCFSYENRKTCDGLSVEWFDAVPDAAHFYVKVPFTVGDGKVLYIGPDNGNIASVAVTMGSDNLYGTNLYNFEEVTDETYTYGYSKYYKLMLSEDVSKYSNLMLTLYDVDGKQIGNVDLQFDPHVKMTVDTTAPSFTPVQEAVNEMISEEKINETIESGAVKLVGVDNINPEEFATAVQEIVEAQKNGQLALVPEQSFGCDEADKPIMNEKAAEKAEELGGNVATMQFFDITVALKNTETNKTVATVTDSKEDITITIALSGNLLQAYLAGMQLLVMRVHNDVTEFLDTVVDEANMTLSFNSSKFSSYAVLAVKPAGVTVSGKVTSFLNTADAVTIELFAEGNDTATPDYATTITGNSAEYSIDGVAAGTYTMKVSKANHVTREYAVTVGDTNVTQDAKIHPKGDVTGDGSVNIIDVSRANLQYNSKLTLTDYERCCADIDNNGTVNIIDVSRINLHYNGKLLLW